MDTSEKRLLSVLSNNDVTFFIPPYQRNYEWTDEQCQVFLDDIIKTYERSMSGQPAGHFFGAVTFFQTETPFGQPNKLVLIDGQQRITTTMLFLAALRDVSSNEYIKNYIDTKYLKNNSAEGDVEYKIKLKQVEADWQTYKNIMLHEDIPSDKKNAAVYRNYRFYVDKLTELNNKGIDLGSIIEKGLQLFSVIIIELSPGKNVWENPQEIFESMNSLGKPLSLADLVRNYLLLGFDADEQNRMYKDYWLHIENTLAGNISNYIRDFMQLHSKTSYKQATEVNYKELYSVFKSIFAEIDGKTILEKLAQHVDVYAWVIPGGKTGCNVIDEKLADLRYFKVSTAYSFLMALLIAWKDKRLTDDEIADILDVFRIYCIRRRLLSLTQAENKVFPTLVNQIDSIIEASDKRARMYEILSNQENRLRLPNDVELTKYLESANFYNFQYCKFVLAMIEGAITKCRPEMTDHNLQIEHIMPQTLSEDWKTALGPNHDTVHQELVHTIGNLTLIRHNQELSNKSFAEKKELYENNAGLQIARTRITDKAEWNEAAIRERGVWIVDYLLKEVLPIPDSMRKTNNFSIKDSGGLSFVELQLIGEEITFCGDPSIKAVVVSDNQVEFEGKKWRMSPLTREICTRKGIANSSGSYRGAQYWAYDGIKLSHII